MRNLAVLVSTAALLAAGASSAAPAEETSGNAVPGSEPVMAVWVERKVDFPFRGLTAFYSCDGIRLKVNAILKMIGARPGFKVDVRACPNTPGPEFMPWIYITAALPQPATPELLAELAKPDSKKELVARVQKKGAPAEEATAQFPARWERLEILGTQLGPVQLGDCELVEQMAREAFTELGARIVDNQMACVPRQVTPGSVRLTLEVLKPVPQP